MTTAAGAPPTTALQLSRSTSSTPPADLRMTRVFGAIDDAETPATRVVDAAKGPAAAGHASNATNARAARALASSIVVTRYELAQRSA
jgi:hypothetical protein